MQNAIEITNLIKHYGKSRGVNDISIRVECGDFYGFIGPNGAGKSTTIRSMVGLIKKNSGTIKIFDMDIASNKVEILQRIGYMPSEAMFYPRMKAYEIIRMAADAHHMDCKKRAEELCERLKVDTGKRIEDLSLGNRKKISIVCAMQHNPALYILDEPSSGLDPLMQKEFFNLLTEANQLGATVFISSHILSEIQTYCNHAAIIKEGKIIAEDLVANLTKTNSRRVLLRGVNRLPEIPDITNLEVDGRNASFLFLGNAKSLIHTLDQIEVEDVIIEEPSLEEMFMHYYDKSIRELE
jgi:ABC-2 type transport system ATP-binding protein